MTLSVYVFVCLSWNALFILPACTAWKPCYFPWALGMHKGRSSALFISSRCITFLVLCDLGLWLRGANAAGSALQHKSSWCLLLLHGYNVHAIFMLSSYVLIFKTTFRLISFRTTMAGYWTWCSTTKKTSAPFWHHQHCQRYGCRVINHNSGARVTAFSSAIAFKWSADVFIP